MTVYGKLRLPTQLANLKYQVPACNLVKRELETGAKAQGLSTWCTTPVWIPRTHLHAGWLWQPPVIPALGGGGSGGGGLKESWL